MDDDNRVMLTTEQAVAMLPDGDNIHTFIQAGYALIGADWSREQILKEIADHEPELSGSTATSMGHGLVLRRGNNPLFIATKPQTEVIPTAAITRASAEAAHETN